MSKYLITFAAVDHGVISAQHEGLDQQWCEAGETVIIKNQPDAGWGLQSVSYTTDGITYTAITDGTFIMPAANITIVAVFKRFVIGDWTERTYPNVGMPFVSGENGQPVTAMSGTANERPTLTAADAGYLYYDTTLKKWIVWNGEYWTDMAGRPTEPRYLKFTAEEDGSSIGFWYYSEDASVVDAGFKMQYSTNGGITWNDYTIGNADNDNSPTMISLNEGENVLFRGDNPDGISYYVVGDGAWEYLHFVINGKIAASGDVTALINNWGGDVKLSEQCCRSMFRGCTGLTAAPELPATTLANSCYQYMFSGCTGLTSAPALPATTLADYCYSSMFSGCTGLTSAPALPATTLADYCYSSMFDGCTGLTSAPALPATTLADGCYEYMFGNCTNLAYIKAMFLTTPSSLYTTDWVYGVAASGTFVKNSAATWNVTGVNGVPSGWDVETADA